MSHFTPFALALALALPALQAQAKTAKTTSPDGRLEVTVNVDSKSLSYSIGYNGLIVVAESPIALDVTYTDEAKTPASKPSISKAKRQAQAVSSPLYRTGSFYTDYNEFTVTVTADASITWRVYNDGVAWRWNLLQSRNRIIQGETAEFHFDGDPTAWLSYTTNPKSPYAMAFQNVYDQTALSKAQELPAFLPATVDCGEVKATILESDLEAYPGMWINASAGTLKASFAPYPAATDYYPWRKQLYVTATEDYIAVCNGKRSLPWRIVAVTDDDTQMPVNNLVYALASPSRVADTSWIKPGKVAWDWWSDWNIRNVDFRTGINTDTYKHYIDFASRNSLEYIILDEGWYTPSSGDMLTIIPEIDLEALISYGNQKGVGIVLWTVFNVLDDQLQEACRKYSAMGIKGFKVDFLDRDDQTAVEMAYRIAQACADHHLILDYHGFYKPTGLNRTYPNVINFEGVFGMEEVKWAADGTDMPRYDVTFPFIRLMAGPVDYTPGAMRNGTPSTWKAVYSQPISMGTRCHQAATYIVHDSPFTMLADTPSAYDLEPAYTSFIASIPQDIEETIIPAGKLGQYIVTARRYGNDTWAIGGLTNWDSRDLTVDLSFLPQGITYNARMLTDGINADRNAEDYSLTTREVTASTALNIHMAPGGGFAIMLTPKQ